MSNMEAKQLKEAYNKAKSLAESQNCNSIVHQATLSDGSQIYRVLIGNGKNIGCAGAPIHIHVNIQNEARFMPFSEFLKATSGDK